MTETISIGLVAMLTWMAAPPDHSYGRLVSYGSDWLIERNAEYRGYTLSPYRDGCGISGISPSSLGKIAYIRISESEWYGPCLVVDVGARRDFYSLVYEKHEIAEVGDRLRELLGFQYSQWGEVFIGLCPPPPDSIAVRYQPYLKFSDEGGLNWKSWPKQEMPVKCTMYGDGRIYEGAQ